MLMHDNNQERTQTCFQESVNWKKESPVWRLRCVFVISLIVIIAIVINMIIVITIIMIFCQHHSHRQWRSRGESSPPISPCYPLISLSRLITPYCLIAIWWWYDHQLTTTSMYHNNNNCNIINLQVAKGQKEMAALQLMVATYRSLPGHIIRSMHHILSYLITILWSPCHILSYHADHDNDILVCFQTKPKVWRRSKIPRRTWGGNFESAGGSSS